MGFKEVKPQRISASSNASNLIRVSFSKQSQSKKFNINIYIGIHIAEKIGLKADDKVKFYIDEDNPRLWFDLSSKNRTPTLSNHAKIIRCLKS